MKILSKNQITLYPLYIIREGEEEQDGKKVGNVVLLIYPLYREGEEEQDGKKVGNVVLPWEMKYFSPMLR